MSSGVQRSLLMRLLYVALFSFCASSRYACEPVNIIDITQLQITPSLLHESSRRVPVMAEHQVVAAARVHSLMEVHMRRLRAQEGVQQAQSGTGLSSTATSASSGRLRLRLRDQAALHDHDAPVHHLHLRRKHAAAGTGRPARCARRPRSPGRPVGVAGCGAEEPAAAASLPPSRISRSSSSTCSSSSQLDQPGGAAKWCLQEPHAMRSQP